MTLEHPQDADASAGRAGTAWLLGRGGLFTIGGLVRAAATLVLLPVITRVLGPAEFGAASMALVVASVVAGLASLGLHSAAMREYYGVDGVSDLRRAVELSYAAIACSVAVAVALFATGPLWGPALTGLEAGPALAIGLATAVAMTVVTLGQNLLRASDRPLLFLAVAFVGTLGGQAVGAVLAAGDGGAVRYLAGVLGGWSTAAVLGWATTGLRRPGWPSLANLRAGVRLGLPTVPHSLGVFVLQLGDRAVVHRYEGPAGVGRYQVAYLIGSLAVVIVVFVTGAWGPLVFGARDRDRWELLASSTSSLTRLCTWVVVGLIVTGPALLPLAAPANYDVSDLAAVLVVIAPAGFAYLQYQAGALVLFQNRMTGSLAVITPLVAAGNIALSLLLVPRFGLVGAAVATLVAYTAWAVAVRARVRQTAAVPFEHRSVVVGSLVLAVTAAASLMSPADGQWRTARLAAGAACAIGLLLAGRQEVRGPSLRAVDADGRQ